jgi:cell division protein FtsL
VLASIVAAAGLAFFYLSQSSHVAAVGYEIDDLQAQITSLRADQQQLILQIGAAQAPTTIIGQATTQLNLRPIDPSAVSFAHRASAARTSRPSPEPAH